VKKWRYLPELVDYIGLPFQNGNGYGTGAIGATTPESFIGGGRGTGFWATLIQVVRAAATAISMVGVRGRDTTRHRGGCERWIQNEEVALRDKV